MGNIQQQRKKRIDAGNTTSNHQYPEPSKANGETLELAEPASENPVPSRRGGNHRSSGSGYRRTPPARTPGKRRKPQARPAVIDPEQAGALLRDAINLAAIVRCETIARALVDKTCKGDIPGTRLLTEVTGVKSACRKLKRRLGPSYAEQLGAEQSWQPQRDQHSAETGAGVVVPEA